jgi:hypothetical protein
MTHEFEYGEFSASFNSYVRAEGATAEDERKQMLAHYIELDGSQVVMHCLPGDFAAMASASVGVQVPDPLVEDVLVPVDGESKFVVRRNSKLVALMRGIVDADRAFALLVHMYLKEALSDKEIAPFLYDNRNQKPKKQK